MSVNLRTRYLGLQLASPLVCLGMHPHLGKFETLVRLEEAGPAAVVLPSLFEEEIVHDEMEAYSILRGPGQQVLGSPHLLPRGRRTDKTGPESHLQLVEAAKAALAIPVIGSLNGTRPGAGSATPG